MNQTIDSSTKSFRLITISVSHYCEKARWVLDKLKFPYVEERHTPPFHLLATGRVGGKTTPVLVTKSDVFTDSTTILKYLNSIAHANTKLYPTDSILCKQVEELEDLFDEQLGPATRRWGYFHVMNNYKFMQKRWCEGVPFYERILFPLVYPITSSIARQKMNITPEATVQAYETISRIFAKVNELLADGRTFLVGNNFSAADLTFALAPLCRGTLSPVASSRQSRPTRWLTTATPNET
ncbi:glutathione S-transferase N-terminal domain-containing protein [Chlorogloeopsis sp. ULAP01]|uniref:glutathione S-transferase family protein n=1 Tax=Chlorogloeopsis sp. ULAP01 TaxID=3056483 RepID=UPI0025AAD091|nr:glutathione S-transferase N-terminal domain-containing protein [Chlorogloeopsis sp. ULAP01]MDM9380041.1 glutathione S-transferase N-terminal domain-containing protein [Chlorogloeopsis sp. ULAP01]